MANGLSLLAMKKILNGKNKKMLSYSELTKGKIIIINNQPYEIIEAQSMFKGRGHSYLQTKLKI